MNRLPLGLMCTSDRAIRELECPTLEGDSLSAVKYRPDHALRVPEHPFESADIVLLMGTEKMRSLKRALSAVWPCGPMDKS